MARSALPSDQSKGMGAERKEEQPPIIREGDSVHEGSRHNERDSKRLEGPVR